MAKSFKLPDLGEGIHEGEVISVIVSVGDSVKEGDPILEVETDKAAVEIPSPFTATVTEIMVKPGDTVKVDDVLMIFDGDAKAKPDNAKVTPKMPQEEAPQPAAKAEAEPVAPRDRGPVPATPATRRLARELGVDLHKVPPSGPGGLVTADDVRAFAETGTPAEKKAEPVPEAPREVSGDARPITVSVPPLPDFTKWGPVEKIPVRSIRRATARHMALSWSQIPHVTCQAEVDITQLEAFRRRHKSNVESKNGRLTLTTFAIKAVVTALKAFPKFNSALDIDAGELILKQYYHIGVAVDTEDGLIVPVIRDADRKSLTELAVEMYERVQLTRQRKTTIEQMQGGTFTITNIGHMGGEHFTPIINYPEVAIMGMGAARMKPVVVEKRENVHEVVPRLILPIVVTFDHRVLDGAEANRFLKVIIDALEDPDVLMMTMS